MAPIAEDSAGARETRPFHVTDDHDHDHDNDNEDEAKIKTAGGRGRNAGK